MRCDLGTFARLSWLIRILCHMFAKKTFLAMRICYQRSRIACWGFVWKMFEHICAPECTAIPRNKEKRGKGSTYFKIMEAFTQKHPRGPRYVQNAESVTLPAVLVRIWSRNPLYNAHCKANPNNMKAIKPITARI